MAQLIRWADQLILQGVAHENNESTASVTTMIRAVLDGVKVRTNDRLMFMSLFEWKWTLLETN